MLQLTRPICFFDLETTGTDTTVDRIVEISILKYFPNGSREIKTRRINPTVPIPAGASEVHGITDEAVKDCPTFKAVANGLVDFIAGCDLAGFNSNNFDIPLLYNEFFRAGVAWDCSDLHFIDVCNIFKRKEERTLARAYQHYCGKELEGAHGAEADIVATMEVFFAQLEQYEDLPHDLAALALYSNYDRPIVDIGGRFTRDEAGDYIFTFGKYRGKKLKDNKDYLAWMLNASFPPDTVRICREVLDA